MKKVTSTVKYKVPRWNFCNIDHIDINGEMPTEMCSFYSKGRCLLHNKVLSVRGKTVTKADECIRASAGIGSTIDSTEPDKSIPSIQPSELMKYAIDQYSKTYSELVDQGFPKTLADSLAKKHTLGTK